MSNRVILSLFLTLLIFLPAPLCADLDEFNFKIIRTAFLNGYVRALSPDMETIKSLKENPRIMKESAFLEVDHYLNEVISLNEQFNGSFIQKAKGNTYHSKGVW